jgi:hypothetical protein
LKKRTKKLSSIFAWGWFAGFVDEGLLLLFLQKKKASLLA